MIGQGVRSGALRWKKKKKREPNSYADVNLQFRVKTPVLEPQLVSRQGNLQNI